MLLLLSLPLFYKLWNISKEYSLDLPLSIVSWTMYHNQLNNAQHGILIYKNALGSLVYIAVLKIQMTFAWLFRFYCSFGSNLKVTILSNWNMLCMKLSVFMKIEIFFKDLFVVIHIHVQLVHAFFQWIVNKFLILIQTFKNILNALNECKRYM